MSYFFWLGHDSYRVQAETAHTRIMRRFPQIMARLREHEQSKPWTSTPPECDGDFENEECIEDDGMITCYFSGPIRPITN